MSLQIGRMFFRKPTGSTVELAIHFANEIFKCVNSCNKIGIQLKNLLIFECKNIISNIYCLTPTYPKTTKVQTQTNQFSCIYTYKDHRKKKSSVSLLFMDNSFYAPLFFFNFRLFYNLLEKCVHYPFLFP